VFLGLFISFSKLLPYGSRPPASLILSYEFKTENRNGTERSAIKNSLRDFYHRIECKLVLHFHELITNMQVINPGSMKS
jgi:hypothetical protein